MQKQQIRVTLDGATKTLCGNCKFMYFSGLSRCNRCFAFSENLVLKLIDKRLRTKRCDECRERAL